LFWLQRTSRSLGPDLNTTLRPVFLSGGKEEGDGVEMTFVVVAIVCAAVVVVVVVAAVAAAVNAITAAGFSAVVESVVGVAVVIINVNSVLVVGTVVDAAAVVTAVAAGVVVVHKLSPLGAQDDVVGGPLDVLERVRETVSVLYFYQFFFVVTIVFPYINEELHLGF
jgi:hypothetical protein